MFGEVVVFGFLALVGLGLLFWVAVWVVPAAIEGMPETLGLLLVIGVALLLGLAIWAIVHAS